MQAELYRREQIIRSLARALTRIRSGIDNTLDPLDRGRFWRAVHDGKCVICGKDRGEASSDLDTLFCSWHCLPCNGADCLLDKLPSGHAD